MVLENAVVTPSPSSPKLLSPQQRIVPPVRRAQAPFEPAMPVAVVPSETGPNWLGVIVMLGKAVLFPSPSAPEALEPQQRTDPSASTAQASPRLRDTVMPVADWPSETTDACPLEVGAVLPCPNSPLLFVPQHCTLPSESTAQVKLLPGASAVAPPLVAKVTGGIR